ncbi:MAG: CHAD domain-containing protein [Phycisphaeraceae bacterium]|nr:CHAD domain-containing protein [Phycisphaeraceae bacterium]
MASGKRKDTRHADVQAQGAGFMAGTLSHRSRVLVRAIRAVVRAENDDAEKAVHQLRVATRRTAAALDAAMPVLSQKRAKAALRVLRKIRRAAGPVRDADVLLRWVGATRRKQPEERAGFTLLARSLRDRRNDAAAQLPGVLPDLRKQSAQRLGRAIREMQRASPDGPAIADVMRDGLQRHADSVLEAAGADLGRTENLHNLRIECKRLRYALEIFAPAIGKSACGRLIRPLTDFQQAIGGFTDCSVRVDHLSEVLAGARANLRKRAKHGDRDGVESLGRILRAERTAFRRELRAARAAWDHLLASNLFDDLRRLVFGAGPQVTPAEPPANDPHPTGPASRGPSEPARNGRLPKPPRKGRRRIAAIDIGTNSIRLIVGETDGDGSYRVLDDEKEITRLGRGLHETGRLDPDTMEHSAVTIARMKSIAEGYGASQIRVVATAACREAKNGQDLLRRVREVAGLEVEIIPAEQEALLAYRSAANAFDLSGSPAAVVDIGGGSLEVVLSAGTGHGDPRGAGLGGGVIERVFSLPLGAVRLTEQFGGATAAATARHKELSRFVDDVLRKALGKLPFSPAVVVGTGGTFTTLAGVLAHKELGPAAQGLFSGSVQGREVRRSELCHVLDYVRELSLRDRSRVPGLPADRADIIVAGLTVIDRLLERLHANSVLIHEGGIRDGLLLSMVRCEGAADANGGRNNPMRGVLRFAKACQYEAAHARHVARLSLSIFDQLVEQRDALKRPESADLSPRDRVLLEAAAVLHDVGYLVNYASHHKHSYHLIVHADLPGLTSREIQVVANIARYHRAAEPKDKHRNFAALGEEDRQRVRALAAILRVADGLDRTHMQRIRALRLRLTRSAANFDITADAEPSVDVWGAVRKSRLFSRVYGTLPHFDWKNTLVGGSSDVVPNSSGANEPVTQAPYCGG